MEAAPGEAEGSRLLWREVGHKDLGPAQKPGKSRAALWPTRVQGYSTLVHVQEQEKAAPLGMGHVVGEGTAPTRWVSLGALHLDHISASVG